MDLIEHLWDELECSLQAKAHHPTSVPGFTVSEWKQIPATMFQHCGKPSQKSGSFSSKGRKNFLLMPVFLELNVNHVGAVFGCSHTFSHMYGGNLINVYSKTVPFIHPLSSPQDLLISRCVSLWKEILISHSRWIMDWSEFSLGSFI